MDDIRAILYPIRLGWRWSGQELEYCDRWRVEEERRGMTPLQKTTEVLEGMMGGVHSFLKLTMETGDDFAEGKLPTLDTNLWVGEDNMVHYEFFEKSMALNQVLQKDSALPENSKISSLTNEMVRRMQNTSELLSDQVRIRVVDDFAQKMINSGYQLEQVRRVVMGGLKGYERKLRVSKEEGGRKLHVSARESRNSRYRKKLLEKSNWFRKKPVGICDDKDIAMESGAVRDKVIHIGRVKSDEECAARRGATSEEIRTTSVLFVDQTPKGELARRLRELEPRLAKITGFRIKIVVRGGTKLKQALPNTNPWSGSECGREDCVTCKQGDENLQDCFRTNILYESKCLSCVRVGGESDKGRMEVMGRDEAVYVGESSRSLYERAKEHLEDALGQEEDSHIFKHWETCHRGEEMPRFKFSIVRSFQDCLSRQIAESVRIGIRGKVLNSQAVYSRCRLPRLTVDREWERTVGGSSEGNGRENFTVEDQIDHIRPMRSKRKSELEVLQSGRPRKKARTRPMELEEWGEDVEDDKGGRETFLREGIGKGVVGGKLRQTTIKILGVSDCVIRSLLLDLVEEACYIGEVGELLNSEMDLFEGLLEDDNQGDGGNLVTYGVGVGKRGGEGHGSMVRDGLCGSERGGEWGKRKITDWYKPDGMVEQMEVDVSIGMVEGENGVDGWIMEVMESMLERAWTTCGRRHLAREMQAKWLESFTRKKQDSDGVDDIVAEVPGKPENMVEIAHTQKSFERPSFKNIFSGKINILKRGVNCARWHTQVTRANKTKVNTTSKKRKASEDGTLGVEPNLAKGVKRLKSVQPKIKLYVGARF